ncbi:serine/threonine-protein kinase [Microbacterium sp. SORGH_AS_0888]|uniref:serine/threonine-protein kinase n=1 Tax=Microbacterium sp. SORGH_AS_0888 TaxID=3041791 RepID=UPI00277F7AE6|nr:serine/threonine-protein kinase [Microbacterium sp. SORGH_AS_0888]MDQ1130723.1 hypothetical protein [Microbacterium sp. SORGH_AS_0888]
MDDPGSLVEPGAVLDGRYRIGALIGTGGMSRVYVAEDLALGRRVAIKVVHAVEGDVEGGERVRTETVALASLTHPSLVVLHDARLSGPGPRYLVMEYVDGPSLSARLAEGPMSSDEVASIAHDLAEALAVVHAGGIVHRDIKPSNILLAPGAVPGRASRAKLADFGIAHLLGSERITRPGTMIGTAAYLAPEVALGGPPQPASDIYSLGLVLLEALTGRGAFPSAQGAAQVLARLAQDPEVPDTLPPLWREMLAAMVQREPSRRPTALAVLETLSAPRRADQPTAVMPPVPGLPAAAAAARYTGEEQARRRSRRAAVLVGGAVAAIVLAGAIAIGASTIGTPAVVPTPEPSASVPTPAVSPVVSTPSVSTPAPVETEDPAQPDTPKGPGGDKDPGPDKDPGGGKDNGKGKGDD